MGQNRKVKIDFQAQGIKEILGQLDDIKKRVNAMKLPTPLEGQLDELLKKIGKIKTEIGNLQDFLEASPTKKKKSEPLAEVEQKIEALKVGIASMNDALSEFDKNLSADIAKIGNAFDALNNEDLSHLTEQLENITNAFDLLINQATEQFFKFFLAEQFLHGSQSQNFMFVRV